MPKQPEIKVSIIISNFNGGKEPIECLKSINKLEFPKEKIETIVVDNGSTDGSKEKIEKLFPKIKLIALKKDIGLPASLNLGIHNSHGKYIMVTNDDIVFEKNSVSQMFNFLEKSINVAVLGGKVYYKNPPTKISQSACDFNFFLGEIKKKTPTKNNIKWLQSCSIMIPRKIFDEIGFFDEGYYPLYFDDFDFCLRVKKAGFLLAQNPKAVFWHGAGKTTEQFENKKVYYWWYKNKIRFYLKHATFIQIITAFFAQIAVTSIKSVQTKQNLVGILIKAFSTNVSTFNKTLKLRRV